MVRKDDYGWEGPITMDIVCDNEYEFQKNKLSKIIT